MKKILYVKNNKIENQQVIEEFKNCGYAVMEYEMTDKKSTVDDEVIIQEVSQIVNETFFHFVFSFDFYEAACRACMETATKYVIWLEQGNSDTQNSNYLGNIINHFVVSDSKFYEEWKQKGVLNCYEVPREENSVSKAEGLIFKEGELDVYHTIDELFALHKNDKEPKITLKKLSSIKEADELMKQTDCFFNKMESEKELSILLKEQLLAYVDGLLQKTDWNAWREMVLWTRRHECRDLLYCFWEFYLLKKSVAIYSEETIQYYENGDIPSIIQMGSFQELSETYFKLLFLLRRLVYDIAPEEEKDIIDYIMDRKVSVVFIKHVIEHNQIENKEKVYKRLEELLAEYEQ